MLSSRKRQQHTRPDILCHNIWKMFLIWIISSIQTRCILARKLIWCNMKTDRFWFICVSITAIECLIAAMLFMHDAFAYRLYDGYFEARFLTSWGFDLAGLACVSICMKELGQ